MCNGYLSRVRSYVPDTRGQTYPVFQLRYFCYYRLLGELRSVYLGLQRLDTSYECTGKSLVISTLAHGGTGRGAP